MNKENEIIIKQLEELKIPYNIIERNGEEKIKVGNIIVRYNTYRPLFYFYVDRAGEPEEYRKAKAYEKTRYQQKKMRTRPHKKGLEEVLKLREQERVEAIEEHKTATKKIDEIRQTLLEMGFIEQTFGGVDNIYFEKKIFSGLYEHNTLEARVYKNGDVYYKTKIDLYNVTTESIKQLIEIDNLYKFTPSNELNF